MQQYIIIGIIIGITIIFIVMALRIHYKHISEKIDEYTNINNNKQINETDVYQVIDISLLLESLYKDTLIKKKDISYLNEELSPIYSKLRKLQKRLAEMRLDSNELVDNCVWKIQKLDNLIKEHNDRYYTNTLIRNKDFFDHCLTYPLDEQQRHSIVSEEESVLVVSSAGSGKTSSIIGKVKYLMEVKHIIPGNILLISYTNKAATELTERINIKGLRGYTFHKLAIDIIGKHTGEKPSIYENTDQLFISIYKNLIKNSKMFRKSVLEYFVDYQETEEKKYQRETLEKLSAKKNSRLRAMFPDMDGNPIYVKSQEEQKICLGLTTLGVKFRYEDPYEYRVADETHSQYKPDFSIFYEKDGEIKRVYLEHYGIDEHGLVPSWFAKDKGITYEEANQKYNDGITWKKTVHEKYGTTLISTQSSDFKYFDILNKLRNLLRSVNIPIHEITKEELFNLILPQNSPKEKSFIRLIVTFATILKSGLKDIDDVLKQADHRSSFIIENIFKPVYELYEKELKQQNQMDFTDIILKATKLCQEQHSVKYDYIIVDEFQDISMDRYNFLKALRETDPPAKLYCVGDDWQSIYRFSGSDMSLFKDFSKYFGDTDIHKIETTYRFGEPLISFSSKFIQKNNIQFTKNVHPFEQHAHTDLLFQPYYNSSYNETLEQLINSIPGEKSILLLGRYSFDDFFLSKKYQNYKNGNHFYYNICGRSIEFLTVHKSKGLEADYVILLQCNKGTYGFPSLVSNDPVLNYVLNNNDRLPYGEERRVFYVAITRAKIKIFVMYDIKEPSVFVDEFLNPEGVTTESYMKHRNANKRWSRRTDQYLLYMHAKGFSIKQISEKMGRSQTAIVMRLGKLGV